MKQYLVLVAAGDRDDSPNYQVAVLAADHIGLEKVRREAFKQLHPDREYDATWVGLPEDLSTGKYVLRGVVHVGFEEYLARLAEQQDRLHGLLGQAKGLAKGSMSVCDAAASVVDDFNYATLLVHDKFLKEQTVEESATPAAGG